MIRQFSLLVLLIGLFSCKQDPYEVDLTRVKHKVVYQNLDSAFRYANINAQTQLIKELLHKDFDLTQFCFP